MRSSLVVMVSFALVAGAAFAQQPLPQSLGAADPSQQIRSSQIEGGAFQSELAEPTRRIEPQQPLITVEPDATTPRRATVVAPAVGAPLPPSKAIPSGDAVGAGVTGWNPATNSDDPARR